MKKEDIDELIQKILNENLTALEAFEAGINLQKSDSKEHIKGILETFNIQKLKIDAQKEKRIKSLQLENELLEFFRTAFRISDSSLLLTKEYHRTNEIDEGQIGFKDVFGIEELKKGEFNEHSADVGITIKKGSILDNATLGIIGNFQLNVSNDSGDDSIDAYHYAFDSVFIYHSQNLSNEQIDLVNDRLKLINSIGIDDYDTFLTICLSLGELDKDWLDKSLFLSQIANDGGKTLAKMINDK